MGGIRGGTAPRTSREPSAIHHFPHTLLGNLRAVARGRLHAIGRAPFSADGRSAAISAVVEIGVMLL